MTTTPASLPAGFTLSKRSSNLLDLVGPLYESGAGPDYRLGMEVDERHINAKGFCHGAVLAMIADVFLGRLVAMSQQPMLGFVTVNLGLTYLAPARLGEWLEAAGHIDRVGKNLAHSSGIITANGMPVLRGTGTFQVTVPR
jgi:acyl-coenzyme A thioesterase 13